MPNPIGNLAGWSDLSEPGWQERLVAKVEEYHRLNLRGRRHQVTPLRACHLDVTHSVALSVLLRDAAAARGLSKVAYARRALVAFLAQDLGLEFADVASLTPRVLPPNERVRPGHTSEPDDGQGFGPWRITGLR